MTEKEKLKILQDNYKDLLNANNSKSQLIVVAIQELEAIIDGLSLDNEEVVTSIGGVRKPLVCEQ